MSFRSEVADVRSRARSERGGLEQAARRERYAFLNRVRRETGAAAIAVAHTRDDQAETLLLRLLRGAGATGLGGMRPRAGRIVRPLLDVSREEVIAHLADRGLDWREDPTNADMAHLRNRVRHELLPYLEARFNPALRRVLARTAGLLADEDAHLKKEAEALLAGIARTEGDTIVLDRAALAQAPPAVARVAVRQALRRAGGLARVGAVHVENILVLARSRSSSGRRLPLPSGREVRYRLDEVHLGPASWWRRRAREGTVSEKADVLYAEELIARRVAGARGRDHPGVRGPRALRPRPDERQRRVHGPTSSGGSPSTSPSTSCA